MCKWSKDSSGIYITLDGKETFVPRKDDGTNPDVELSEQTPPSWSNDAVCMTYIFRFNSPQRDIKEVSQFGLSSKRINFMYWKNTNGDMHRDNGPALIHNYPFGYYINEWWKNGIKTYEKGENDIDSEYSQSCI